MVVSLFNELNARPIYSKFGTVDAYNFGGITDASLSDTAQQGLQLATYLRR